VDFPSPNVVRGADDFGTPTSYNAGRVRFAAFADFTSDVEWALTSGLVAVNSDETSFLCPTVVRFIMPNVIYGLGNINPSNIAGAIGISSSQVTVATTANVATVEVIDRIFAFYNWINSAAVYTEGYWAGRGIGLGDNQFEILPTSREKNGIFLPSVRACILNILLTTLGTGYGYCNEDAFPYYLIDNTESLNANLHLDLNSILEITDSFTIYGSFSAADSSRITVFSGSSFTVQGSMSLENNNVIVQNFATLTSYSGSFTDSSVYVFGNWRTIAGDLQLSNTNLFISKGASLQVAGDLNITSTNGAKVQLGLNAPITVTGEFSTSGTTLEIDISLLDLGVLERSTDALPAILYSSHTGVFDSISLKGEDSVQFCVSLSPEYRDEGLFITYTITSKFNPCDAPPISNAGTLGLSLVTLSLFIF